jgi:hypothetical protein
VLAEQAKTWLEAAAGLVKERQNLAKLSDTSYLDQGKEGMDNIRASIAGMEDQEKLLLEQRTQRVQNMRRFTALAIGLSSIFGIIFLLIAGLTVSRQIGAAAKAQTQIKALNADLERRVEQRTAALKAESAARLESEGRLAAVIKSAMDYAGWQGQVWFPPGGLRLLATPRPTTGRRIIPITSAGPMRNSRTVGRRRKLVPNQQSGKVQNVYFVDQPIRAPSSPLFSMI